MSGLFRTFLLCGSLYLSHSVGAELTLPYQSCSKKREAYTHRVASQANGFSISGSTEASDCVDCKGEVFGSLSREKSFLDMAAAIKLKPFGALSHLSSDGEISPECFLASGLRGNSILEYRRASYCKNKKNRRPVGVRRHCINQEYVKMVSEVFSEVANCLDFTIKEKKMLFNLINHESGFILNARSSTWARCFGQLTIRYIQEINRRNNIKGDELQLLYKRATKKCPGLKDKILSSGSKSLTCEVTHSPYSCLLYTALGSKLALVESAKVLNNPFDYSKRERFSAQGKKLFQLPIKSGEMLVVKFKKDKGSRTFWNDAEIYSFVGNKKGRKVVKVQKIPFNYMGKAKLSGKEKRILQTPIKLAEMVAVDVNEKGGPRTYIFWSDRELQTFMRKIEKKDIEIKRIREVPLFENKEDVVHALSYWSHNGGGSVYNSVAPVLIRDLKRNISKACKETSKEKRCSFRRRIQRGKGISTPEMLSHLKRGLLADYSIASHRKQVSEFMDKIISDNKAVFSDASLKLYKKWFKGSSLGVENQKKFLKQIQQVCPTSIF